MRWQEKIFVFTPAENLLITPIGRGRERVGCVGRKKHFKRSLRGKRKKGDRVFDDQKGEGV